MNPTMLMGSIASPLGIGSSLVNQGVGIHRSLNPPQQQAQAIPQGHCPTGTRLVVLIKPDGTRELLCMQEQK